MEEDITDSTPRAAKIVDAEYSFIWEHFKFNAEQRLKGFNFFVLFAIFVNGGVLTAISKNVNPLVISGIGFVTALLSTIFLLVDSRSKQLLDLTITALKEIEQSFRPSCRLFARDDRERSPFVRYTIAIRAILGIQMFLSAGYMIYGLAAAVC